MAPKRNPEHRFGPCVLSVTLSLLASILLTACKGGYDAFPGSSEGVMKAQPSSRQERPNAFTSLYQFKAGKDGQGPRGLVALNGKLYGVTSAGGAITSVLCSNSCGTIFSFDPSSEGESVVYRFKGGQDGFSPSGRLVAFGGKLYGTTFEGGDVSLCYQSGCGTIFSFDPSSGVEATLHVFKGGTDGANPTAGLVMLGDEVYGTTWLGGSDANCAYGRSGQGCGTVFRYDPSTGSEKVMHSFKGGRDGSAPESDLYVLAGKLYGTTTAGGSGKCGGFGCGTIFSLDPTSGVERTLYRFKGGNDGLEPVAGLTSVDGMLYGTTLLDGGAYKCHYNVYELCGTLFSFNLSSNVETVLYQFGKGHYGRGSNNGEGPNADLVPLKETLYGTTIAGGSIGDGVVFSFSLATKKGRVIYDFSGSDGNAPDGLLRHNGKFYGTTASGGSCRPFKSGCGTIFAL